MNDQTMTPREIMLAHNTYLTLVCEEYSPGCGDSNASRNSSIFSKLEPCGGVDPHTTSL